MRQKDIGDAGRRQAELPQGVQRAWQAGVVDELCRSHASRTANRFILTRQPEELLALYDNKLNRMYFF